jgi:uncharacterized phiE125 gp8 family phage protein
MIFGQPIRTVAPAGQVISLPEVKEHLRITDATEDAYLARLIQAATAQIEQHTGLGLLLQTWTQTFSEFADVMELKRRPLMAVGSPAAAVSVAYLDSAAATQALGTSLYRVTGIGSDQAPGAIRRAYGATWPTTYDDAEAVAVTYTVGYGTAASAVPAIIRQAIMTTVADWYGWRETVVEGASLNPLPWTVENLLIDWRPVAMA